MSIKAEIIADSLNQNGNRLTTFILEYPRWIHAEFMTHRVFSRNAASSRAIPFEKFVRQITENPAMPEFWGKNQKGMQAVQELSNEQIHNYPNQIYRYSDKELAQMLWLESRDLAIEQAKKLNNLEVHKQIVNRILEPWFHIRVICSATEYENFFALRAHKDAQPEIQVLASKMLEEYNKSEPQKLENGEWHIPFKDRIDDMKIGELADSIYGHNRPTYLPEYHFETLESELKAKVAIARCARVSYYNYEGKDDYEADIKLCDRLFGNIPRHLSPTEHVAQAMGNSDFIGNFRGFKQFRKFFEDENLKDSRVIKSV